MKKALAVLLLTLGLAFACSPAGATKPAPSPTPSPSPAPDPVNCGFMHLGSGGKLTSTGSAVTSYMVNSTDDLVFVFIGMAPSNGLVAPTPTLSGGGATWTWLGTFWKKPGGAPRNMSVFVSDNFVEGALTIGGLPVPKTHTAWSVASGGDVIVQSAVNSEGGLETQHSVTLDVAPTSSVIAGYIIGQQQPAEDGPPYVELGQGHTSFITEITQWASAGAGDYQTATVYWPQPGHSEGAAYEVTCE